MQTDPKGYDAGTLNLYGYVDDDPIDHTDSTGEVIDYGFGLLSPLVWLQVQQLKDGPSGNRIAAIERSSHVVHIRTDVGGDPGTGFEDTRLNDVNAQNGKGVQDVTVTYDPFSHIGGPDTKGSVISTPTVNLSHELAGHAYDDITGTSKGTSTPETGPPGTTPAVERDAIAVEDKQRAKEELSPRAPYYPGTLPNDHPYQAPVTKACSGSGKVQSCD
jgi:hypothetical protein